MGDDKEKQEIAGEELDEDDRISRLPDSLNHAILDFLRCAKDVVRLTVLSKIWKGIFDSYASFDFDEKWFKFNNTAETQRENFKKYVDGEVANRLNRVPSVDKFRLFADNVDVSMVGKIGNWICAAMAKNVKELDVQVHTILPFPTTTVYLTELDSITFLKLSGMSLPDLTAMKMRNLRGLSLKRTAFAEENIKKIQENCPSLEDLRLVNCPYLSRLQISSLAKLKRVEVQYCETLKSIKIASSNLETFWYHEFKDEVCEIDLRGSENLKNLTMKDRTMSGSDFVEWIGVFPLLEKLTLHDCNGIERLIGMTNISLKSLSLIHCGNLVEVDTNALNLHSFHYEGRAMCCSVINLARLSELKLAFEKSRRPANFTGNFDGSRGFLMVYTKQTMKIFDGPARWEIFQSHSCKIEFTESLFKVEKTVENWLRECHGKSLEVKSSKGDQLLTAVEKLLVIDQREDDLICCGFWSKSNKCWRHYIEDVKVLRFVISEKTLFEFTWRSRRKEKLRKKLA